MKKIYTKILFTLFLAVACGFAAQAQWNVYRVGDKSRANAPVEVASKNEVQIGHCTIYDEIWPSDGLSLDHDARVGVGAVLTREMFEPYIGGKIVAMYVGWDDVDADSQYECFVRSNFTGENLTTGEGNVSFGWNKIDLDTIRIPDVEQLCVGFYTDVKANVPSIPFIYPLNVPNTVVLYSGEKDESGKEVWYDMHTLPGCGKMPIVLAIEDENGDFVNFIEVGEVYANIINWKDEAQSARVELTNKGSNDITSLEIATVFADTIIKKERVALQEPLAPGSSVRVRLPIYSLGSGEHKVQLSQLNDETPKRVAESTLNLIAVSRELENKYTQKPVLEYFVSEESYQVPVYLNQLFWPAFTQYEYDYTLVFQHLDDKYMIGDNEALLQMLELVDNDSSLVEVPSFTVNRSPYNEYLAPKYGSPFNTGTPYPDYGAMMWESLLGQPTFASVNVTTQLEEDAETITITVNGNIAEGVMPQDEPLYLTVYLMERNVESEDQLFWDDANKEEEQGTFTHDNIVREILTEYWGDELDVKSGNYTATYTTKTYPEEWRTNSLFAVAFLNRGQENGHMERQIINSNSAKLKRPAAVETVKEDNVNVVATHGRVYVDGCATGVEVYNVAGTQLPNEGLADGIYIVRRGEWVGKVLVK